MLVWQSGRVGAWILAIGLARYAFVLAGWLLPFLRAPLRRAAGARRCVQQGVTLLLCLLPPVGATAASVGGPWRLRIVGVVRRRHHLSGAQGPLGGERCCCSDPDRAILVIHTGKGVIRRCAAIVPGQQRKTSRRPGLSQSSPAGAAPDIVAVDRTTGELRRGGMVIIDDDHGAVLAHAAETVTAQSLAALLDFPMALLAWR